MLVAMAIGLAAAAQACPIDRTQYRLRGAPNVTAGFTKQRFQINYTSMLFVWVRTADGRRWWFSMNSPNGYGGVFLAPDVDPTRITRADREKGAADPPENPISVDFDTFDAAYDHIDGPPQIGDAPPAHLFARGLGPLFWYNPVGAANGDKSAKAASVPIAMFDIAGCAARP
ncbi:MAG: hypothetical protein QOJ91_1140 [Sphingomonadales bacterium]|nr:hypothetical protein [Sphingomonadales bacterium]